MVLAKPVIYLKDEIRFFHLVQKSTQKWAEDLNLKPYKLKISEENIGTTLQDTGVGKNTGSTGTGSNKQDQVSTDRPHENQTLHSKGSQQQNTQPTGWMGGK